MKTKMLYEAFFDNINLILRLIQYLVRTTHTIRFYFRNVIDNKTLNFNCNL